MFQLEVTHIDALLLPFAEDLSNLLSKNAFPVNAPLSALHLLSLEGLLAVIQCMADRADNASTPAGKFWGIPLEACIEDSSVGCVPWCTQVCTGSCKFPVKSQSHRSKDQDLHAVKQQDFLRGIAI